MEYENSYAPSPVVEELRLVLDLQKKLKAKTKIEVVRRGLRLLEEVTERDRLRQAYRNASLAVRA
jgi:hypothetical protein